MTPSTESRRPQGRTPALSRRAVILAIVTSYGVIVAFGLAVLTAPVVGVVIALVGVIGAFSAHDNRRRPSAYALSPLLHRPATVRIDAARAGDLIRVDHSDAA